MNITPQEAPNRYAPSDRDWYVCQRLRWIGRLWANADIHAIFNVFAR